MTDVEMPESGDVIEFIEQKKMRVGVCLSSEKNKAKFLIETSRLMTLPKERYLHVTRGIITDDASRKVMLEQLRSLGCRRKTLAEKINISNIWKSTDHRGVSVPIQELLDLFESDFPDTDRTDLEAAFIRKVFIERCYFSFDSGKIYSFSEEEIRNTLDKLEKQAHEQNTITQLAQWISSVADGHRPQDNPPDGYDRLLKALELDAAGVNEQPDKLWLKQILKNVKTAVRLTSFQILIKLGHFQPDENLNLIKFNVPKTFSNEAQAELSQMHFPGEEPGIQRRDLTDRICLTIDGASTSDMDDAISVTALSPERFEIGIHITDVSAWIQHGSILDQEARDRGITLYLPDKIWHMFPQLFAEELASLQQGVRLPCLSTLVIVDNNMNIISTENVCSVITVNQKLTYDEVDSRIAEDSFDLLLRLARKLRETRVADGAIIMPRPEVHIDASEPGKITLRKRQRQANSQLIVSELMILANKSVAEKAAESDIPFPYRTQNSPRESVPKSEVVFNPYVSYCQRRMMPRAETSIKPKSHFSLGLKAYTNITSPLRRYFDVLAQRQFKAILGYEEPYTGKELTQLLHELESSVSKSIAVINNTNRYWFLKYLAAFRGKAIDAIVLDRFASRYQIWIEKLCIDADLPLVFGQKLKPDQKIQVLVEKVSPRDNVLKLRLKN